MRRVSLDRPFTDGMVTDQPAHALGPKHTSYAQDGFSPQGVFKQRQGWAYDGTTADVADDLVSVYRAQFILADTTRTITVDDDGELRIHNPSSSGTLQLDLGSTQYLPRCVYRDELILCGQDGLSPVVRYSGANHTGLVTSTPSASGQLTTTLNQATISSGTNDWGSAPQPGAFVKFVPTTPTPIVVWLRILSAGDIDDDITLESFLASGGVLLTANSSSGTVVSPVGYTFPTVTVYNAGTVTVDADSTIANQDIVGYGTKWSSDISLLTDSDALFVEGGFFDNWMCFMFGTVASNTSLTNVRGGDGNDITDKKPYFINRRCPFKDAATHKGSFWGTGNASYPSRVYVGPPGWNLAIPPGFTEPFDPQVVLRSSNPNDFLMDFIDVPSSYDGDDNVAILPSPNPLLVLKRKAVYGVYGSYPNFSVDMVADGIGCIDIRSAHSYDEGQFWAGEGGIYWYTGGQIRDLTAGRINREWRALTRDFDYGTSDYCTLGVSQGYLIVHITTGGGVTQRTYLCDLRDGSWQSRISNFTPRYMHTSRIPGEKEKLLAVSNARQGRVLDFAPALDGSGTAADDAGSAPRLAFHSTSGLGQANGIEGITNFVEVDVHANVYDAGAAGSTVLSLSSVHGGGTSNQADATKTLTAINSDTADRIDRHSRKIGRKARLHQIRGEVTTLGTDSNATKIEVPQIVATFRDLRSRA